MTEEQRYAIIQGQIAEINEMTANNPNPVKSLLSAMLTAEMYGRNERHHMRAMEARIGFVRTLEARICTANNSFSSSS